MALTKLVARGAAFQLTTELARNPVPLTVRVKPGPPATVELGLRLVITGVGEVIVKVAGVEVTGPGLVTVMEALPGLAMLAAGTVAVN